MIKKPMLAVAAEDLSKLQYPKLLSPKLDGIRCLKVNGQALSRKFKPIPNHYVRSWIEMRLPDGFDGELMLPGGTFNEAQSAFMRQDGTVAFEYHVFDYYTGDDKPFSIRYEDLSRIVRQLKADVTVSPHIHIVPHHIVTSLHDVTHYEEKLVAEGYEGVMLRCLNGPYKFGRSTLREEYLLKVKRWQDAEAVIIGFEEQMRNENEAQKDELGHTKRSTHAAGMVPAGTLGKLIVRDGSTGAELRVGTGEGMTKEVRQEIWNNREKYLGRTITYKYQPSGMKDLPRFPIWKGFRHEDDQ